MHANPLRHHSFLWGRCILNIRKHGVEYAVQIQNHLAALRKKRGLGATEVAQSVGVSRQTIYAIEAGNYVPNTLVTLRLARLLEVPTERVNDFETVFV